MEEPPKLFDIGWILELDSSEFREVSTLIYSTLKTQLVPPVPGHVPPVPESVRQCREIAIRVKPISNDLYAVQLRKTFEAVCEDKGAPKYLPNGKRAILWQRIAKPEKQNVVGQFIFTVAHELKTISNGGAHYSEVPVSGADTRKLEHLLALIIDHIYDRKTQRDSTEEAA